MQRKKLLAFSSVIFIVTILLLMNISTTQAITYGSLDEEGHPFVFLLVMDIDGSPAYRCSGTLIAPTIFLTAGHCAGEPGEFSGMRVFTQSNVDQGRADGTNHYPYNDGGPYTDEAVAWASFPGFTEAEFFLHDEGVVKLSKPIYVSTYGVLPIVNSLDQLATKRGQQDTTFTAVGYGLQQSSANPLGKHTQADRVRMVAYPKLDQINAPGMTGDIAMNLSNNAKTGGTCFGDSGGPNFAPGTYNVVAGVTSYGLNYNCGGTGGVFRMDRQNVQDFINQFIAEHP